MWKEEGGEWKEGRGEDERKNEDWRKESKEETIIQENEVEN